MCTVHIPDVCLHGLAGFKSVRDKVELQTTRNGQKSDGKMRATKRKARVAVDNMKDQQGEAKRLRQQLDNGEMDKELMIELSTQTYSDMGKSPFSPFCLPTFTCFHLTLSFPRLRIERREIDVEIVSGA